MASKFGIILVFGLTYVSEVNVSEVNGNGEKNVERKSVVIVGGGAAGIAAATRLYENGIENIIVLEAEKSIGGRIRSVYVDNGVVEMGAHWIHGEENNVVYELVTAYGGHLTCPSKSFDDMVYARSTGEILAPELACRMNDIFCKLFKRHEYSEDDFTMFTSCGDFFVREIKIELGEKNLDMSDGLKSEFIELCHQALNLSEGAETWFDVSTKTFADCPVCEGNFYIAWNRIGFQMLFGMLMRKSNEKSEGDFYRRVVSVDTEVERISLQNEVADDEILVECSDGRKIRTDHVIVTVSLGVLREKRKKLFERFPLPELKINTIENLGFGTVDKILLEFPERWWPMDGGAFNLLWTEIDRAEYEKAGLKWATDLFQFHTVDSAPYVLCGWITGDSARIMEGLDEQKVFEAVIRVLRKFLSKISTLPEIPDPVRIFRSTWYLNEHFRGSYSNRTLRSEAADVSPLDLSIPVTDRKGKPILLFAGEATSSDYPASVNGAIESGWREADRIIRILQTE